MDLDLFWHSIRASAGNSFLWETAGPNIFRGEYHDSFNMDLMCKDMQLGFESCNRNPPFWAILCAYLVTLATFKIRKSWPLLFFH